jgi:hypothetical protein
VEEIRVFGWAELQEEPFADSWQPALRRFRSNFAYRGRNDLHEGLRTSLSRRSSTGRCATSSTRRT